MSNENQRINKLENNIKELKKKLEYINKNVQIVLGRHSSQIRVLEEDGSWGDYSGNFNIEVHDNLKIATKKAMNHYNNFFAENDYYKNKTLGLFISTREGLKLTKILQDRNNRLDDTLSLKKETIKSLMDLHNKREES
jgi:hypothetical protein